MTLNFKQKLLEKWQNISMQHGMEMMQQNDEAHLKAMENMKAIMQNPEKMNEWFKLKKIEFDLLPEDQ